MKVKCEKCGRYMGWYDTIKGPSVYVYSLNQFARTKVEIYHCMNCYKKFIENGKVGDYAGFKRIKTEEYYKRS